MRYGAGPVPTPWSVSATILERERKFPDRPGARPANSLEVSRTKKRNNFLEKNPVKTRKNYSFNTYAYTMSYTMCNVRHRIRCCIRCRMRYPLLPPLRFIQPVLAHRLRAGASEFQLPCVLTSEHASASSPLHSPLRSSGDALP
jgi:hypothetical protein